MFNVLHDVSPELAARCQHTLRAAGLEWPGASLEYDAQARCLWTPTDDPRKWCWLQGWCVAVQAGQTG